MDIKFLLRCADYYIHFTFGILQTYFIRLSILSHIIIVSHSSVCLERIKEMFFINEVEKRNWNTSKRKGNKSRLNCYSQSFVMISAIKNRTAWLRIWWFWIVNITHFQPNTLNQNNDKKLGWRQRRKTNLVEDYKPRLECCIILSIKTIPFLFFWGHFWNRILGFNSRQHFHKRQLTDIQTHEIRCSSREQLPKLIEAQGKA